MKLVFLTSFKSKVLLNPRYELTNWNTIVNNKQINIHELGTSNDLFTTWTIYI